MAVAVRSSLLLLLHGLVVNGRGCCIQRLVRRPFPLPTLPLSLWFMSMHARTTVVFGYIALSHHMHGLSLSLSENNSYQQSDQSGATTIHPCTKSAIVSVSCLPLLCFSFLGIVIILVRSRNYSPSLWNNKLFSSFFKL